jgi:hypothetical protein
MYGKGWNQTQMIVMMMNKKAPLFSHISFCFSVIVIGVALLLLAWAS